MSDKEVLGTGSIEPITGSGAVTAKKACKPRINAELLAQVKERTLSGKQQQDEIAIELGIHRNTVYRYQRALGLHACQGISSEQEETILRLLKTRGTSWIGKELGVGEHQVRLVVKKYRFRRRRGQHGYRFHPTTAQFIKIMDLALSHTKSAAEIARIAGTPYKPTLKICHRVTACERFITGRKLDSYLPMKWAKNNIGSAEQQRGREEEVGLYIVDAITNACFDGKLPQDHQSLIHVCTAVCISIFRRARPDFHLGAEELQKITNYYFVNFSEAISTLRTAEDSRWTN